MLAFFENCRAKCSLTKVPAKISRTTYPTFQRQKLAAEAMQNRSAKGEGGEIENQEEDDEEEMWAKLHSGLPADWPFRVGFQMHFLYFEISFSCMRWDQVCREAVVK